MRQRRSIWWAVLTAVLGSLFAAMALASGSVGEAAPAPSSTPNPVELVRAGSSDVVFVLWRTSCGNHPCFKLQRTTNGGRTFSTVSAPPIAPGRLSSGDLSELVFANPSDGYAVVDATHLYGTFDGGRTWQREVARADQSIAWITSSATAFYAVAGACRNPRASCGGWGLYRSPVAMSEWTGRSIPFPLRNMEPPQVAASGSTVWLTGQQQALPGTTFVAVSHDDGSTFVVTKPRVLMSVNGCGLDAVSPLVIWAQCDQGNMHGDIPLSRDGGVRWIQSQRNFTGNFAWGVFDPVSASTAYFIDGMYQDRIYRASTETLRTREVGRPPNYDLGSLVFVNRSVGFALSQPVGASNEQILYGTQDGGDTWRRILG